MSGLVCASTSKPSVPEFTLAYDTHFSDKLATYTTDPYTGEQQVSSPAKHYEWQTINVTIKNQPFTPYKITMGNNIVDASLYYNVKFKGHFEDEWGYFDPTYYVVQGTSAPSTVITFFIGANGPNGESGEWDPRFLERLSADRGGQIDFQVEALSGYVQPGSLVKSPASYFDVWVPGVFNGTESGWSNTQTITIGDSTPTATPNASYPSQSLSPLESQNTTPNQQSAQITIQLGIDWSPLATVVLLGVVAVLLAVTVVLLLMRRKKQKQ